MTETLERIAQAVSERYRVERELGAGGMARVFLAQDLRHERQVALKVLRPEIAGAIGADRFLAEIRTTASLQHPHILPLFDSGRVAAAGPDEVQLLYYVMPYVEGESLRQRLAREQHLPIDETARLAAEVAEALDYAHRRGVLHRDIKPENILLHDGHALVADFGIALALTRAGDATRLTGTGFSIGTPQYMSPEQAAGERQLDGRTDVYALGATLYEMLTGEPPFSGPTPQIIMARAATGRPRPVREVRPRVPPHLEAAAMTALAPLPADRFATAADLARALTGGASPAITWTAPAGTRVAWRPVLVAAVLAALVTGLATTAWMRRAGREGPPPVIARLVLPLPQGQVLGASVTPFALSPDGSRLAYAATEGGTSRLYLRPLDRLEPAVVPGTDGASAPFFSPDGQWIGYHAAGRLWKVAIAGGAPIALAEAPTWCGAGWDAVEAILFSVCDQSLYRVGSGGGTVTPIAVVAAGPDSAGEATEFAVRWPAPLPGGRQAIVTITRPQRQPSIGVVDLSTGTLRHLLDGNQAVYLPSGHLLYDEREGRMRVVPFDLDRLAVTGEPVPAFETFRGPASGSTFFSVSATGTLVHVAGGFARRLELNDRSGHAVQVAPEALGYRFPRFSPDGRRIAVTIDPRPSDIWVFDAGDWRATRITTSGGNIVPIWSPDGKRIAFTGRGPHYVTGPGEEPRPLGRVRIPTDGAIYLDSWAADGTLLGFQTSGAGMNRGRANLVMLSPGDSTWRDLLASPALERDGAFSPDGRWIAYTSDRSGRAEVYVRPRGGNRLGEVVSTNGGREPRWADGGREIVFRRGTSIMAVPVRTGAAFQVLGPPRELFTADYDFSQDNNWDVTADGRQFVFVRNDAAPPRGLMVVVNWFASLPGAP